MVGREPGVEAVAAFLQGRLGRRRFTQRLLLAGFSSGAIATFLAACGQPGPSPTVSAVTTPTDEPATAVTETAPTITSTPAPALVPAPVKPAPVDPAIQPAACFDNTGKCVHGLFYAYWLKYGGLEGPGYPITDEFDGASPAGGKPYRVQYFERARFEYHQEHTGTPQVVLLGLLGREQFAAAYPAGRPAATTGANAGARCFEETGHCLSGAFLAYWERTGGVGQHGYPISDEFDEVSPTDGQRRRVQYCERSRFEYHPDKSGTPGEVSLGLLGHEQFAARYPNGQPVAKQGPAINVWAATSVPMVPAIANIPARVYVPHERGHTVIVIDPDTFEIIDRFPVGIIPHHITPSWDLSRLYINNTDTSSVTELDPWTGKPGRDIPIPVPYNLYFTPDGTKAIVAAEPYNRLDFYEPLTWRPLKQLPINGSGVDHLDMSADGTYLLVSCEFDGQVIKVDTVKMAVIGAMRVGGFPIDIKLSPDGSVFYVANQDRHGVSIVDPLAMKEIGFLPTGRGAHGLAVSRDTKSLYVSNRLQGTVSVIDFATRSVVAMWYVGGSPDMFQVSPGGRQLWFSNRYHDEVTVVDTRTGEVIRRIPTDPGPHGLCYFPQQGRYCIGHNGVYR